MTHAFKHARDCGALTIADEVQTGWARSGTHYWGFETQNVIPDIVVVAKGLGNGVPIAAVATRREIADSMSSKQFFVTYGGNPTNCRVARAVMQAIDDDGIQENSLRVGARYMKHLQALKAKHELIGDVRGYGLFMGVELVKDRDTKEPAPMETVHVFEVRRARDLVLFPPIWSCSVHAGVCTPRGVVLTTDCGRWPRRWVS